MNNKILTISFIFYNDEINIIEENIQKIYSLIDEIDILIVDDHSRYENYEELKNLINNKYPKINLFRNEENLNIAKNGLKSLKLAKTKYVKRVDGDDLISSKEEIKELINYLKKEENEFDIAFNSWYYKSTRRRERKIKDTPKIVMFNTNVIYKVEFIKNFEHPEKVTSFLEDKSMILLLISQNNPKIKTIDIPIYVYLGRGSSAVSDILKRKEKYIEIFFDILKNISVKNLSKKNKKIILYQISRILSFIYILTYGESRDKKGAYKKLKSDVIEINPDLWNEIEKFDSWSLNYLKLNYLNGHNIFLPIIYFSLFKERARKRNKKETL